MDDQISDILRPKYRGWVRGVPYLGRGQSNKTLKFAKHNVFPKYVQCTYIFELTMINRKNKQLQKNDKQLCFMRERDG